jgi:hypothetical protein
MESGKQQHTEIGREILPTKVLDDFLNFWMKCRLHGSVGNIFLSAGMV